MNYPDRSTHIRTRYERQEPRNRDIKRWKDYESLHRKENEVMQNIRSNEFVPRGFEALFLTRHQRNTLETLLAETRSIEEVLPTMYPLAPYEQRRSPKEIQIRALIRQLTRMEGRIASLLGDDPEQEGVDTIQRKMADVIALHESARKQMELYIDMLRFLSQYEMSLKDPFLYSHRAVQIVEKILLLPGSDHFQHFKKQRLKELFAVDRETNGVTYSPYLLRQAQLQIHYKNDPARLAREFAALRAKQYDEYWDTDEFEITVPYPHTAIADGLKKLQQQRMQARKAHKHGDVFYFTEAIKELKQEMQPYSKLRTVANN